MKSATAIWCLLLTTSLATVANSANILALLTAPSRSHHIWNNVLVRGLAARGHHVTVLSPDMDPDPAQNVTQILIEDAYENDDTIYEGMTEMTALDSIKLVSDWGELMCEHGMASQGVRTLLNLKTKFDLVLTEVVTLECYWGIVDKFGRPPIVAVTAFSSPPWAEEMVGNVVTPSYMPSIFLSYTDRMDLFQRAHNALVTISADIYRKLVHLPKMDALTRRHLGPSTPSIAEIEGNVSMVFVNTQIGIDHPRPLPPAMVEVGGLHLSPARPLPQDLKQWMDTAKNGVIFFSLGSNVRSDKLSSDKIATILSAFGRLRQRVLWKYESPDLPGKPDNVRIEKWLPQRDVLGHPKLLLFISHCGLLSVQEAAYFGVPVVGLPFFGDQFVNLARLTEKGVAEGLVFGTLNENGMVEVITKVLETPSYRTRMRELSKQLRDLPQHPLQVAVFWIEYVIRHKGALHLKSAATTLTWMQLHLLDLIAVLVLAITLIVLAIYFIARLGIKLLFATSLQELNARKKK